MSGRAYGSGSVYQRASDGRWIGKFTSRGQRATFTAKTREGAEGQLDAWLAVNRPEALSLTVQEATRKAHMVRARSLGTHTKGEWAAKLSCAGGLCTYCKRPLGRVTHKDHVIPVSRGGSDSIDNVTPACWDCNMAKGAMTGDEFIAWATETGYFEKPRMVQLLLKGRIRRVAPSVAQRMKAKGAR